MEFRLRRQLQAYLALTIDAGANYLDFEDQSIDRITAAQAPVLTSGELRNARAPVLSLGGRVTFWLWIGWSACGKPGHANRSSHR